MATTTNFERLIDNEALIVEVKNYPCLYDLHHPDYKSKIRNPKNRAWNSIARKLFKDRWESFSDSEKGHCVKALTKRWKGLRDALTRNIRLSKDGDVKKKAYVYAKPMSFLLPYLNSAPDPSVSYEDPTAFNPDVPPEPSSNHGQSSYENSGGNSPTILQFYADTAEEQNYEYTSLHSPMEVSEDYSDGDRMFLLSILPYLRKLKPSVKLDIKIKFMQIIKSHIESD